MKDNSLEIKKIKGKGEQVANELNSWENPYYLVCKADCASSMNWRAWSDQKEAGSNCK